MRARLFAFTALIGLSIGIAILKSSADKDEEWTVISIGLPDRIEPKSAMANMGYYILKQTHEPLFRETGPGLFNSKILLSWDRNASNTLFRICPALGKSFDSGRPFTARTLVQHLSKSIRELKKNAAIKTSDDCVVIEFEKPFNAFFKTFSQYEFAPSVPSSDPRWEIGLGPFQVVSKDKSSLTLQKKEFGEGHFNSIRFLDYSGPTDPILQDRSVEDFNRVLLKDQPDWLKHDMKMFDVSLLQTVNLFINIKDPMVRALIFQCMPIHEFRKAFMNGQLNFSDVDGVIPVGVGHARRKMVAQNCKRASVERGDESLRFINWNTGNEENLKRVFEELEERTGLKISTAAVTTADFIRDVFGRRPGYDLYVVAIDAVRPEISPFFEPIVDQRRRLLDFGPILDTRMNLLENASGDAAADLASEINQEILDSHVVLPLYQEMRTFYYPRKMKGNSTGRNFLEYPEVAELKP